MSNRTVRTDGDTTRPTFGATMLQGDAVRSTKAGLNIDSSGQPEIWNAAGGVIMQANSAGNPQLLNASGTILFDIPSTSVTLPMVVKLAATGGAASTGVIASLANPFGYDVIITSAVWRITTQSTGASTVDIGVGANATTSNDGLIDGLSGAAAGIFNNEDNAGTNGRSAQVWTSATFLNIAEASGDVDGLVAVLYVTCYRAI